MRRSMFVVVAVLALVGAACGEDPDLQALGSSSSGGSTEIVALDNVFGDDGADVEVAPGAEISWVNNGRNDHNIVPIGDDDSWGVAAQDFRPGDTYTAQFDDPGLYELWWEKIPVVLIDDRLHGHWRVSADRLRDALTAATR